MTPSKVRSSGDRLTSKVFGGDKRFDYIRLRGYITTMRKIVQRFKALSDETRLRILALLSNGEMCVCDLMAILDLPQSTVSRHLAYLRNAGWVEDRRQGVWMYYRLFDDNETFASDLRELLKRHLANHPQATHDREALAKFRACKTSGNCG